MKATCFPNPGAPGTATRRLACTAWIVATLASGTSSAATLHVWPDSPYPMPPYDSWGNAATNIQDAVDIAQPGDLVLVTNGVYATGGQVVAKVVVDKAVTVQSVNGPVETVIDGANSARCVFVGTNAILSGFTLTQGYASFGGGALCVSSAILTNCTLTGNAASSDGGGVYGGTLYNCLLSGNSAQWSIFDLADSSGGGAFGSTLYNCTLINNYASAGGGAYGGTLYNSLLTGNSAGNLFGTGGGGGAYGSGLYNCTVTDNSAPRGGGASGGTLYNCIAYFNSASFGANYFDSTFNYSCTTPMPTNGVGNIAVDPQMASLTHLSTSSPCIAAGNIAYASGPDIDGEPWANPPCMGADQVTPGQATGALSMSIEAEYTNVAAGFVVRFVAQIQGATLASVWDFGDGTFVTNQAFASHAWSAPGNYTVRLTGYNDSFPNGVSTTAQIEVSDTVYYVNQANSTPVFPYASWATAATNIQNAIGAGTAIGRLVLVTNGVYASGSIVLPTAINVTNRIALTDPVQVRSVNGPNVTVIEGAPGIRCAYLGTNAILSGFTLTNGNAAYGGGAYCVNSAILANCVVTGNSAGYGAGVYGAGVYGGALYNCILSGNSATNAGGGFAAWPIAIPGALHNCTVTANSAAESGGGVLWGTLYNCIVYFNTAPIDANYRNGSLNYVNYSCTTPMPTNGVGNITNSPDFADMASGDLHLRYGSPGIDAGTNLSSFFTTDLDGNPRPLDGDGDGNAAFDMGAYEFDARSMIPSDWFTSHGLDPSDPQVVSGNPDQDAFTTFQEWLADTDPTNALSFFHIETVSKNSPATISLQSSSNRVYTLWGTPQLSPPDWTPVPGDQAIPGNGGMLGLSDLSNAPQQFYRVQVNLP